MFTPGQDFICETKLGMIRCKAKAPHATSGFKALQLTLTRLLAQLPIASKPTIDVDGVIGPSTVLAAQLIATRLAEGRYSAFSELASAQPEEAIPYVAQHAMEIAGVFEQILQQDPKALLAPSTGLEEAPFDPMQMLKGMLTAPRIAAVGVAALGLTGLALVASASDRRSSGIADRSGMLPDSDGTDDYEEDDDDDGDADGAGDSEPEAVAAPSPGDSAHAA